MSNLDAGTQEQVRNALARILSSDGFSASARNRRLLEYVVAERLAGRADRIKAYTLATVVFERGPDFDPQLDPVVRLEASRLRKALEHYYLTAGKDDPVRIDIPKGSYIPSFEFVQAGAPAELPPQAVAPDPGERRRWGWRRSVQRPAIAAAAVRRDRRRGGDPAAGRGGLGLRPHRGRRADRGAGRRSSSCRSRATRSRPDRTSPMA